MPDSGYTSSVQDYLETILSLSDVDDAVRVTDIASSLGISKASVSQALRDMADKGLVVQERYGPVKLTDRGRMAAMQVRHKHETIYRFLVEVLGVSPRVAEADACALEHVVSKETLQGIAEHMRSGCRYPGRDSNSTDH